MCPLHFSLDADDPLCRLVPGEAINVPHLDTRIEKCALMGAVFAGDDVADIRDWFPAKMV